MSDPKAASGANDQGSRNDAIQKGMSDQEIEAVLKRADEQLKKSSGSSSGRESTGKKAAQNGRGSSGGKDGSGHALSGKKDGRDQSLPGRKDGSGQRLTGKKDGSGQGLTGKKDGSGQGLTGKKDGSGQGLTGKKDGREQNLPGRKDAGYGLSEKKDNDLSGLRTSSQKDGKRNNAGKNTERQTVGTHDSRKGGAASAGQPGGMPDSKKNTAGHPAESLTGRAPGAETAAAGEALGNHAQDGIRTEGWLEPVDMTRKRKRIEPGERITVGWVLSDLMEGIWILFKLAVVVSLFTVIAGFFLTRDLCIRGRNGERAYLNQIQTTSVTAANRAAAEDKAKAWMKKAKREKLTLVADDKSILVARAIRTKKKSDKWAVILHGYNGNMEDVYDIAMRYQEQGYNVLTPDLRANGESEGMFPGMGWTDRMDIINWIDVILQENPSAKVVIHGIDVGADAALMLSGEAVKSSIKAVIADSAYTNAWDIVKKEFRARHEKLPVFPFMYTMNPVMKAWAGFTLKEADAVSQVKRTAIPILLIRGKNDTYASEDMTQELNEAIASPHEVLNVAGAGHEECRFAEPENYYSKVFDFTGFYVN